MAEVLRPLCAHSIDVFKRNYPHLHQTPLELRRLPFSIYTLVSLLRPAALFKVYPIRTLLKRPGRL